MSPKVASRHAYPNSSEESEMPRDSAGREASYAAKCYAKASGEILRIAQASAMLRTTVMLGRVSWLSAWNIRETPYCTSPGATITRLALASGEGCEATERIISVVTSKRSTCVKSVMAEYLPS